MNAPVSPADLAPPSPDGAQRLLAELIPLEGTGAVDLARQRQVVAALRPLLPLLLPSWRSAIRLWLW